jgi:hypothetical protein
MQLARPGIAQHPFQFGRGIVRELGTPARPSSSIGADLRLFAMTFLAGFIFVSVLIA